MWVVKEKLIADKKENDKTLTITTLDKIRKEHNLKFKDSKLKSIYKKYIDDSIESANKSAN